MSLMELFKKYSAGNHGNQSNHEKTGLEIKTENFKEQIVNVAELKSTYVEPQPNDPLATICHTPNGTPFLVLARSEQHKALLMGWNPGTAH
ncbi:MAG: hypothetical protein PHY54_00760 [Methylococcales bacterium]|nr:hypothetical protein [Methylococcales bacterium]